MLESFLSASMPIQTSNHSKPRDPNAIPHDSKNHTPSSRHLYVGAATHVCQHFTIMPAIKVSLLRVFLFLLFPYGQSHLTAQANAGTGKFKFAPSVA